MDNGITISQARKTVFVNDAVDYSITELTREPNTGILLATTRKKIPLERACDNIEWKPKKTTSNDDTGGTTKGELWMGTVMSMATAVQNDGLPVEEGLPLPGGLAIVVQDEDTGEWGPQRIVYNHDGTLLSQISSAVVVEDSNKIVLGSPSAKGILVCDFNDNQNEKQ